MIRKIEQLSDGNDNVVSLDGRRDVFEDSSYDDIPASLSVVGQNPQNSLKSRVANYFAGYDRQVGDRKGDYRLIGALLLAGVAITIFVGNNRTDARSVASPVPKEMTVLPGEGISDVVKRSQLGLSQGAIDAETNEIKRELDGNWVLDPGQKIEVDIED